MGLSNKEIEDKIYSLQKEKGTNHYYMIEATAWAVYRISDFDNCDTDVRMFTFYTEEEANDTKEQLENLEQNSIVANGVEYSVEKIFIMGVARGNLDNCTLNLNKVDSITDIF